MLAHEAWLVHVVGRVQRVLKGLLALSAPPETEVLMEWLVRPARWAPKVQSDSLVKLVYAARPDPRALSAQEDPLVSADRLVRAASRESSARSAIEVLKVDRASLERPVLRALKEPLDLLVLLVRVVLPVLLVLKALLVLPALAARLVLLDLLALSVTRAHKVLADPLDMLESSALAVPPAPEEPPARAEPLVLWAPKACKDFLEPWAPKAARVQLVLWVSPVFVVPQEIAETLVLEANRAQPVFWVLLELLAL